MRSSLHLIMLRHARFDQCAYPEGTTTLVSCANAEFHDLSQYDEAGDGSRWLSETHHYEEDSVVHVFPADNQKRQHSHVIHEDDDGVVMSACTCDVNYDLCDDGGVMVIHNQFKEESDAT